MFVYLSASVDIVICFVIKEIVEKVSDLIKFIFIVNGDEHVFAIFVYTLFEKHVFNYTVLVFAFLANGAHCVIDRAVDLGSLVGAIVLGFTLITH